MPKISHRGEQMPPSPIRKLVPFAEEAKKLSGSKKILNFVSPPAPAKPSKTSFGKTLSSQVATQMAAATEDKIDMSKLPHEQRIKALASRLRYV
jgi:hypothetical protein